MFIRRTQTRNRVSGQAYFTHRLVESLRVGKAVKQRTLLNMGSQFELDQAAWPALAARIEQLLHGRGSLLASTLSETAETLAQRYAAHLLARQPDELMRGLKGGRTERLGGGRGAFYRSRPGHAGTGSPAYGGGGAGGTGGGAPTRVRGQACGAGF
jgi:hypothetical protein